MAVSSCVFAYKRLSRPGMSSEIRMFFLRKHLSYVAAFLVIWTVFLASVYYEIYFLTLDPVA